MSEDDIAIQDMMIYGLERSGTNYLTSILESNFNVEFHINGATYSLPNHKHFRPYNQPEYFSQLMLVHHFKYDSFLTFDAHVERLTNRTNLKYVVISKNPYSWFTSFNSFARKNKMFFHIPRKHLNHRYIIDYNLYFEKWLEFKRECPEKIMIIRYESLLSDFSTTVQGIMNNFSLKQTSNELRNPDKVSMSKKFNAKKRQTYLEGNFHEQFSDDHLLELSDHLDPQVISALGYKIHYPDGIKGKE